MTAAFSSFDRRSVWRTNAEARGEYTPTPPLHGELDCDVAIVGGGFTGVSTAFHLKRRFPERRIVLCEAELLGHGASGQNGGQVLNFMNTSKDADPELVKRIFDTTKRAIDSLEALILELGLDVPFRRDGCAELLTDARRAEHAQREVERLQRLGLPLRFVTGPALARLTRFPGVEAAVFDPTAGQLDGLAFLRAMRAVLLGMEVHVHERSRVLRIEEGRVHSIHLPNARLRAKALVLATNAYTPALGYFRAGLVPLQSHVIATAPVAPRLREELGWGGALLGFSDDRDRISYGSVTSSDQIVFGGGSNAAYGYGFKAGTARSFAAVEHALSHYVPGLRERGISIRNAWSGPLALTLSRVATMGVRGEHRNVYYALGYSGHGITLANLAGEVLADLYVGEDARWRGLPFFQRRLERLPPEPFRVLGYHAYTFFTGRSPRRG